MKEVLTGALVLSVLATPTRAGQSKPAAGPRTRHVFVAVTNRAGAPVLDLDEADFEISEQGVKRPIERAALAKSPMRIALVIDTSDGAAEAVSMIRKGMLDFLAALPLQHEVMIASTGRQMRVRVPPTTDRKKLNDAARSLFSDGGATRLMDGLLEIDDRFMKNATDRWPVFVMVTSDGAEGSAGASEKKFNDWARALPGRGVVGHAIVLKVKGNSAALPDVLASHVAQTTGGRYEFMNTSNSLPAKFAAIAEQLNTDFARAETKYEIVFHTDATEPAPVSVAVAREGVTLQMSVGRLR